MKGILNILDQSQTTIIVCILSLKDFMLIRLIFSPVKLSIKPRDAQTVFTVDIVAICGYCPRVLS